MDSELVARAPDGDPDAFATLAAGSYGRLHRVAQNILGDLDAADDATQQAVVDIWRKLPQLRELPKFEAWSFRILVNACYQEVRRTRHVLPGSSLQLDEDAAAARAMGGGT